MFALLLFILLLLLKYRKKHYLEFNSWIYCKKQRDIVPVKKLHSRYRRVYKINDILQAEILPAANLPLKESNHKINTAKKCTRRNHYEQNRCDRC